MPVQLDRLTETRPPPWPAARGAEVHAALVPLQQTMRTRRGWRRSQRSSYRELFHKRLRVSYIPVMAVDPELLEILACPNCKTPVHLVKNGTALKCSTCNRVYPIKDDIPVMLIDEATIEP